MGLGLILRRLRPGTFKRLFAFAAEDAAKVNKPKLVVAADMVWCALRYGASVFDYHNLQFCRRGGRERKTFVTMGVNVKVVKKTCQLAHKPMLEDKVLFNTAFDGYLKRKWCDLRTVTRDGFRQWCDGLTVVFAKRSFSSCGHDVVKYAVSDFADAGALYDTLTVERFDLAEEAVVQNGFMDAIYPGAVNTLRLVTMLKDGEAHLLYAVCRFALTGYVDNLNAGGACMAVDVNSGTVTSDAMTKDMQYMTRHPDTGFVFKGAQFPMWDEAVAMVKEAAHIVPQVRYTAWDVALSRDNGPLLIEGNYHPGYDLMQLADQVGKKDLLLRYV
jgi:hypothetical protein